MTSVQLRVFIGSAMAELRDVRSIVRQALEQRGISAFVYEADAGAQPETVVDTSLRELRNSDIFVAIFWQRFPKVTSQEFQEARALGKPCFVYIRDFDSNRDPDLKRLLETEVFDLVKGVSYDFFDDAVKLSHRVADDVLSWLVRRNRELTAELATKRISNDELAKLEREVDRLQASSREPLPRGTAVDRLARDLRGWFASLGYGIERETHRSDDAFGWIINIPERRGYTRVLVRGIEGEAKLADFSAIESLLQQERTDEAWLISVRRVSEAVRQIELHQTPRRIFCYTFDELIDQDADFSKYFEWLETEVLNRHLNDAYIPLSATKDEYQPDTGAYLGRARYGRDNGWLEGYIDRWLADPSKEHISILGEFGTGKTSFALHYAWTALQAYRDAKQRGVERPRVPLVIPLRDYAKAVSVESLFSEFFFRKYEMLPGYSAFEQLNRMGKLLLIFDGFDEMAAKIDRQEMINNFWRLARVVVPGAKAILTCRTEHFPEAKEGRALLGAELKASISNLTGESPQFEVLELEKLDDTQIRQLLAYHTDLDTVESIMQNPQLLDLARRPVMAGYILEALPEVRAGKAVDLARVYLYSVTRKMERDIENGRTFTSLADKVYFLCEIAWEMWSTDSMSLNYRQFPDRLANLFGDAVKEQKDLDHWHFDMMGQSLLVRNAEGDHAPAHRSLIEFFVAYKLAAELGLLAGDFTDPSKKQANLDPSKAPKPYTWSSYFRRTVTAGEIAAMVPLLEFEREELSSLAHTFGHLPLSNAVAQLMESMLKTGAIESLLELAMTTSNTRKTNGLIGGNAITLVLKKNRFALRGKKLPRTNLDYADFTGADLTGCDLDGASLRQVRIRAASLEEVRLCNTDLSETFIEEIREVACVAVRPDGAVYAAGYDDGTVRIGDMASGRELLNIRAHTGPVNSVAWSFDPKKIVSGGDDGRLAMWNTDDARPIFVRDHAYSNWVNCIIFNAKGDKIITGGGIEDDTIKIWNLRGDIVATERVPGNQINWLSRSKDGSYIVASYWNRNFIGDQGRPAAMGIALFRFAENNLLTLATFRSWGWRVLFSSTGTKFFSQDHGSQVAIIRADTHFKQVSSIIGVPMCISQNDELLVVQDPDFPDKAELHIWYLPTQVKIGTMRFGPKNRLLQTWADPMFCAACFSDNSSVLVGGSDDGTIRFWDTRLFRKMQGNRAKIDKHDWPTWWQNSRILVPESMEPNPGFCNEIRVLEQRVSCIGLRLDGAKGLSTVRIAGFDSTPSGQETAEERVIQWFVDRGASIAQGSSYSI